MSDKSKPEGAAPKSATEADFSQEIGKAFSADSAHTTERTGEIDANSKQEPSSGHTTVRGSHVDASKDTVIDRAKRKEDTPDDVEKSGLA